jgi:AraC-like DNA-binding protein
MKQLVSNFADAEAIFGKEANLLYARLNSTDNVNEMVTLVEIYLQKVISKKIKDFHPLDTVSKQMLTKDGIQDLDNLSKQSFLSTRQFIRKFEERTGISPKMFCKIVRFDKAYRFKNNNPNWDWLSIALECGYYDYQHLTKDYLEFTNHTPVAYYEIDKKAPERDFGLHFG